jgi:hypothetical protein
MPGWQARLTAPPPVECNQDLQFDASCHLPRFFSVTQSDCVFPADHRAKNTTLMRHCRITLLTTGIITNQLPAITQHHCSWHLRNAFNCCICTSAGLIIRIINLTIQCIRWKIPVQRARRQFPSYRTTKCEMSSTIQHVCCLRINARQCSNRWINIHTANRHIHFSFQPDFLNRPNYQAPTTPWAHGYRLHTIAISVR